MRKDFNTIPNAEKRAAKQVRRSRKNGSITDSTGEFLDFGALATEESKVARRIQLKKLLNEYRVKAASNPALIYKMQEIQQALYLLKENWVGSRAFGFKKIPASTRRYSRTANVDQKPLVKEACFVRISVGKHEPKVIVLSNFEKNRIALEKRELVKARKELESGGSSIRAMFKEMFASTKKPKRK